MNRRLFSPVCRIQRAGRSVGAGVVFFLLMQLSLGLFAEYSTQLRDPLFGDKFTTLNHRLDQHDSAPPVTVVMIGTSRTGLGFHGQQIESDLKKELRNENVIAFNLGVPATGPISHLVYLNRLESSGIRPNLILFEVLPSMVADLPDSPLEKHWMLGERLNYGEVQTTIQNGFPAYPTYDRWATAKLAPSYQLRFQIMSRLMPSWLPLKLRLDGGRTADFSGWSTPMRQEVTPQERARLVLQAQGEYAPVLAELRPGGPAAKAMRVLLQTCHDRGIPFAIVLMPEGSEFKKMYRGDSNRSLLEYLHSLANEFDSQLVDAREWLDDDCFYDGHHLFARGAERFSQRMTKELILPKLKGK